MATSPRTITKNATETGRLNLFCLHRSMTLCCLSTASASRFSSRRIILYNSRELHPPVLDLLSMLEVTDAVSLRTLTRVLFLRSGTRSNSSLESYSGAEPPGRCFSCSVLLSSCSCSLEFCCKRLELVELLREITECQSSAKLGCPLLLLLVLVTSATATAGISCPLLQLSPPLRR